MIAVVLAVALSLAASWVVRPCAATMESPVGDFVGWFRLAGGGDMPAWIHVDSDAKQTTVQFSMPAQGLYDIRADTASVENNKLSFARTSGSGQTTRFDLVLDGGVLKGQVVQNDKTLGELRCRPAVLRPHRGDGLVDAAGCYRSDDGAVLRVSLWAWKELRCLDLSTGAERTLFVDENGELFAGSALYTASRIEARYRIVRDAGGQITELIRSGSAKDRTYRRLGFKERELTVDRNGAQLSGTLLAPDSPGPHPVAVILGGSDVQVRADVRWEAEILSSFGLATFAYDLSGRGRSTGRRVQALEESAEDVSAIVDMLAKQADVDARRIGLCGTSRGGWLGPLTAARNKQVGFLILISAPAVSPREQLTSCRLNFMRAAGHGASELADAKSYLDLTWKCHLSDRAWKRYFEKRKDIERKGWLPFLQGPPSPDSEDVEWQRLNLNYDPVPALKLVRCPVLCLSGSADQVVEPSINAPILASCFAAAGNKDWTITIVPDASHGLTAVDPESPFTERPIEDEQGFAPEAWESIRQWLKAR